MMMLVDEAVERAEVKQPVEEGVGEIVDEEEEHCSEHGVADREVSKLPTHMRRVPSVTNHVISKQSFRLRRRREKKKKKKRRKRREKRFVLVRTNSRWLLMEKMRVSLTCHSFVEGDESDVERR